MNVTFHIGPASTTYSLVEFKVYDLATVPPTLIHSETPSKSDTEITLSIPEPGSYQATLKKFTAGVAGNLAVLNFTTGNAVSFPSSSEGFCIIAVEDESSSSSISSSSSSSISSSSSTSTSSASSTSTSSESSTSSRSSSSTSSVSSQSTTSVSSLSSPSSSSSGTSQSSSSSTSTSSLSSSSSSSLSSSSSS